MKLVKIRIKLISLATHTHTHTLVHMDELLNQFILEDYLSEITKKKKKKLKL